MDSQAARYIFCSQTFFTATRKLAPSAGTPRCARKSSILMSKESGLDELGSDMAANGASRRWPQSSGSPLVTAAKLAAPPIVTALHNNIHEIPYIIHTITGSKNK